jgi:hypothetical protein
METQWPKLTDEDAREHADACKEIERTLASMADDLSRYPGGGTPAHAARTAVVLMGVIRDSLEELSGSV